MMFTKDSAIVKAWVRMVQGEIYGRESIPNLSNLRDVVIDVLDNNKED